MQDFLDLRALRDIGLTHDIVQAALRDPRPAGARLARVTALHRDHLVAHDGVRAHELVAWPTLRLALEMHGERLVVGDWLWCTPGEGAVDGDPDRGREAEARLAGRRGWALARLARRNLLARRDPAGGRQALVANVDTALLVMGLDGDFNLRRLDRFLVLVRSARARPVVVLSKADRCADPAAAVARVLAHVGVAARAPADAAARRDAGAESRLRDDVDARPGDDRDAPAHARDDPDAATRARDDPDAPAHARDDPDAPAVVALDARAPAAAEALAPWLARGATLVMLGSSGAGKTTLANTLARALDAGSPAAPGRTGEVRAGDERGQHTTTARTLRRTGAGACLIDTPGLRQLWLDADADELQAAFPEIRALSARCRYGDCRHRAEPGCAVRDGVSPERLANFHKLLREAARDHLDWLERRRQRQRWKQLARERRHGPVPQA